MNDEFSSSLALSTGVHGPGLTLRDATTPFLSLLPLKTQLASAAGREAGLRIRVGPLPEGHAALLESGVPGPFPRAGSRYALAEASFDWGDSTWGMAVARASEWPGDGRQAGRVSLMDSAALTLQGTYRLGGLWGLTGQYTAGYTTSGTLDGDGYRQRLGAARADRVAVGLIKSETWLRGDRLSLTLAHPLRSGYSASGVEVPLEGTDERLGRGFGLRPGTREIATELNYSAPLFKSSALGLSLVNRMRHSADVADERVMSIRFSTQF